MFLLRILFNVKACADHFRAIMRRERIVAAGDGVLPISDGGAVFLQPMAFKRARFPYTNYRNRQWRRREAEWTIWRSRRESTACRYRDGIAACW
jgi:hypothetical protein